MKGAGLRSALPEQTVASVGAGTEADRGSRARLLSPGDVVFREHDRVCRIHVVEEGLVMLHHVFPDGRRQIVDLVGPGELCSWEDGTVHNCTAEALTCCRVASYGLPQIEASPDLQRDLARRLRAMVLRMQDHAALLGRKTSLERVASLLARLAEVRGRPMRPDGASPDRRSIRVSVPLTRREMADHLGITQETVSRSLTELRRRGVIAYEAPNEMRIENGAALEMLSGSRGFRRQS